MPSRVFDVHPPPLRLCFSARVHLARSSRPINPNESSSHSPLPNPIQMTPNWAVHAAMVNDYGQETYVHPLTNQSQHCHRFCAANFSVQHIGCYCQGDAPPHFPMRALLPSQVERASRAVANTASPLSLFFAFRFTPFEPWPMKAFVPAFEMWQQRL